jgi:hypothetical protein
MFGKVEFGSLLSDYLNCPAWIYKEDHAKTIAACIRAEHRIMRECREARERGEFGMPFEIRFEIRARVRKYIATRIKEA